MPGRLDDFAVKSRATNDGRSTNDGPSSRGTHCDSTKKSADVGTPAHRTWLLRDRPVLVNS